jgi:hypothetical protein
VRGRWVWDEFSMNMWGKITWDPRPDVWLPSSTSSLLLETSMVDRQPCMMCDTTVGVTQLDAQTNTCRPAIC